MTIVWQEQSEADVPLRDDWLNPRERARMSAMRFAKRRADWRVGRWTAKFAVATYLGLPIDPRIFEELEIRSAASGAPEVWRANRPVEVAISLSHRQGRAVCAAGPRWALLGCDLEQVEPHSGAFLADYFTPAEQALVASAPPAVRIRLPVLLWSAKESLLKALGLGLRLDTRSVGVRADSVFLSACSGWQPLRVCSQEGRVYQGWWCERDQFVRTLVTDPAPAPPETGRDCQAGCASR